MRRSTSFLVRHKSFGSNFRPNMPQIWPTNQNFQTIKKHLWAFTHTITIHTKKTKSDHKCLFQCSLKILEQILVQKCPEFDLNIKIFKQWKKQPIRLCLPFLEYLKDFQSIYGPGLSPQGPKIIIFKKIIKKKTRPRIHPSYKYAKFQTH